MKWDKYVYRAKEWYIDYIKILSLTKRIYFFIVDDDIALNRDKIC